MRAFKNQSVLRHEFDKHQDHFTSTNFMFICATRAFGLWVDLLTCLYITYVVLKMAIFREGKS